MSFFLGIDLGTSSVKALLMDDEGAVRSIVASEYPILAPSEGFAEQEPCSWWEGTVQAVRGCLADASVQPSTVRAVGLSGQMHGMVLLDAKGAVLRPAVIWCDQRSSAQVKEINERIGPEELGRITLNPLFPGFQVASLLWVLQHEPRIPPRIAHVVLPKDYIRYRLTGEVVGDFSDASSTLAFDLTARCWSARIIEGLGMQRAWFPRCTESTQIIGAVSRQAGAETGLAEGTPVIAGSGPTYAGRRERHYSAGRRLLHHRTVGQVLTFCDRPLSNPLRNTHVFCNVIPHAWYAMAATLSAGLSLSWFREKIVRQPDYDQITAEAEAAPAGSDGLLFLPYLAGERTPHLNPSARAVFFGLTLAHTPAHMTRAVMEGVVFSLRDGLEVLLGLGGARRPDHRLGRRIPPGGLVQILADILGREIRTTRPWSRPRSAPLLPRLSASEAPGHPLDGLRRPGSGGRHDGRARSVGLRLYTEMYGRYRSIYERTKGLLGADGGALPRVDEARDSPGFEEEVRMDRPIR